MRNTPPSSNSCWPCAARATSRWQTIKSIARRRWQDGTAPTHDTWYEPLTDAADIERAVHWALAHPGVFVNSAGDLRLLGPTIRAANRSRSAAPRGDRCDRSARATRTLFVRGFGAQSA